MKVRCPSCTNEFEAKTQRAVYCSTTCRSRAARDRKAAAANAEDEAKTDTPAEHSLVKAVRKELEDAGAIDTVDGQLALQLARRIAKPDEPGISALSKEVRSLIAAAKATGTPAPDGDEPTEPEEEDEVTRARRAREEARQEAGLG